MNKITDFFKALWGLTLFTIKTLWVFLKDDMKKEAQTYKEEREQQKKQAEGKRRGTVEY